MKNKWSILPVVLLAVFGLLAAGCSTGGDDNPPAGGGTMTEVLDLQKYLAGVEVGETDWAVIFAGPQMQGAGTENGNCDVKVVATGTGKGIEVSTKADWAGFDLNNSGCNFAAGDTIVIRGTVIDDKGSCQILLNLDHGGWKPLSGWNPAVGAGIDFENEFTLTASDVTSIKSASPTNIRIRSNKGKGSEDVYGAIFVVDTILINGLR